MDSMQRRQLWIRRLARGCVILVLAVTSLSAYLRLSHAGLGCADWPACYGERLRQAQRGAVAGASAGQDSETAVLARVAHRIAAVLVLLLVVMMLVLCFGNRPWLGPQGGIALAILALALFLAVLGRWTAGARIPAVAMGNLLGGALMVALSVRLAWPARADDTGVLARRAGWAAAALLLTLALGTLVSASYAGLSCTGPVECFRSAAQAGWPIQALDPWAEPRIQTQTRPVHPAGAMVQLSHHGVALLASIGVLGLAFSMLRRRLAGEGLALLGLLGLQMALGLSLSISGPTLGVAIAHNIAALSLLAGCLRRA